MDATRIRNPRVVPFRVVAASSVCRRRDERDASAIGFRSGSFSFVTISLDVQKSHKVHTKTPQRRFIHATPSVKIRRRSGKLLWHCFCVLNYRPGLNDMSLIASQVRRLARRWRSRRCSTLLHGTISRRRPSTSR
jgi:hypothetical protein